MKKIIQILFLNFGLLGVMLAQSQKVSVSGKVTDSQGLALPGVNVVIKGTTNGTVSNNYGNFILPAVNSDATLMFSFIGMKTNEITSCTI